MVVAMYMNITEWLLCEFLNDVYSKGFNQRY